MNELPKKMRVLFCFSCFYLYKISLLTTSENGNRGTKLLLKICELLYFLMVKGSKTSPRKHPVGKRWWYLWFALCDMFIMIIKPQQVESKHVPVTRRWSNVTKSLIWLDYNAKPFARHAEQLRKHENSLEVIFLCHPSLPCLRGVSPLLQMSRLFSFLYCWRPHRYRPQLGGPRAEHDRSCGFCGVYRYPYWELSLHVGEL